MVLYSYMSSAIHSLTSIKPLEKQKYYFLKMSHITYLGSKNNFSSRTIPSNTSLLREHATLR